MKKLLSLTFLFVAACATSPKSTGPHTDVGIWEGKVQMTNTKTNYKKWANVVWASNSGDNNMRVDISAVLDVPIATFIKNDEGYHLWVFNEKKHYFSKQGERLFSYLTKLSIDPKIFYSLLGQPQQLNGPWSCKEKDTTMECRSSQKKLYFSVEHDEPNERIINIENTSKSLRLRLSRSKVQTQKSQFQALSLYQFKTIEI